jgi:4-hydroxy-tetrahydrodipicolinate reductase
MMKLMIVGAAGRMGKEVIRAAAASRDFALVSAVDREDHPELGKDAGAAAGLEPMGVMIGSRIREEIGKVDAVIDFSLPPSTAALLEALKADPKPAVIGTTGLDEKIMAAAREASSKAPILISPNLSYGVAVLKHLAKTAQKLLRGFDIEVVEVHHRGKADAPSGTADALLQMLKDEGGEGGEARATFGRSGKGARRKPGEIGVHSLRGGSVTGEHTIFFLGEGEKIEISHCAETRGIFASGALGAARWLAGKPAGLYSMDDLFK